MSWETQVFLTIDELLLGLTFGTALYVVKINDKLEKIEKLLEEKDK